MNYVHCVNYLVPKQLYIFPVVSKTVANLWFVPLAILTFLPNKVVTHYYEIKKTRTFKLKFKNNNDKYLLMVSKHIR